MNLTRAQKALFLAVMNRCVGDKMVELEIIRLKRGLSLQYHHHIDMRKTEVPVTEEFTPSEAAEVISYFAQNVHKGHAFLSEIAKKNPAPLKAGFIKAIDLIGFVLPGLTTATENT